MTTGPVNNNQRPSIDTNMVKRSGIQFGKGTLKSLEEVSIYNSKDRTLQKEYQYNVELTNGTRIELMPQKPGAKIEIDGEYTNFEKLENATISGTHDRDNYNLFGCKNAYVQVGDYDAKRDVVKIGDHPDGTKSENNNVAHDESDTIDFAGRAYFSGHNGYTMEFNSEIIQDQYDTGRRVEKEDDKPAKTYSHDGKLLKDSYVNAKEEKLPGGYTVKTSIGGEERWYFDPKGKPISEEQFNNRPAWFKE